MGIKDIGDNCDVHRQIREKQETWDISTVYLVKSQGMDMCVCVYHLRKLSLISNKLL